MKTLHRNLIVTESEIAELNELFDDDIVLFRKVKLFGAGHPQLPDLFGVSNEIREEFMDDHSTTHAKFVPYESIEDIKRDENFWRNDLTPEGCEFDRTFLPIYE